MTDVNKEFKAVLQDAVDITANNPPINPLKTKLKSREQLSREETEPYYIANILTSCHNFITLSDTDEILFYKDGFYHTDGDKLIRSELYKSIGSNYSTKKLSEVVSLIKAKTTVKRDLLDSNKNIIVLRNGVLDIDSMELLPHSPRYLSTSRIDIQYNPDSECPNFINFINGIHSSQKDTDGIQELFGYCLLKDYKYHKSWFLHGTQGLNGKSTLVELLADWLGDKNTTHISLQELEKNKFAKSDLYGKLANIYADLPEQGIETSGVFKQLCDGSKLAAEIKHKGRLTFSSFAKMIFSCNAIPLVKDDTDAFYRRLIIVTYNKRFTVENGTRDYELPEKMRTDEEFSGILNWALVGLTRLRKNNRFSNEEVEDKIREKYTFLANPLIRFFETFISPTGRDSDWIDKKDLYPIINFYLEKNRISVISPNALTRKIKDTIRWTTEGRPLDSEGRPTNSWLNIQWNNEGQKLKSDFETIQHQKMRSIMDKSNKMKKESGNEQSTLG